MADDACVARHGAAARTGHGDVGGGAGRRLVGAPVVALDELGEDLAVAEFVPAYAGDAGVAGATLPDLAATAMRTMSWTSQVTAVPTPACCASPGASGMCHSPSALTKRAWVPPKTNPLPRSWFQGVAGVVHGVTSWWSGCEFPSVPGPRVARQSG